MRKLLGIIIVLLLVLFGINLVTKISPKFSKNLSQPTLPGQENVKVVSEESVVIGVVKKVSPSVVTIAATNLVSPDDPFSSMFGMPSQSSGPQEPQNIGSGFIVSKDGIIVTNKHVVSDTSAKYQVITSDNKKYDAEKIYRDPANDIAVIKIAANGNNLPPVELGDSDKLQVGQLAVAIGTPLGEFNGSVTSGIISGLGRGITAGSSFQGFVEQLDNVIQTDAAISPGNSGGPLLNSSGQVIGVNTAVSQSGQNIGFALPVNLIKEAYQNFSENGGQFARPFLGVSYRILTQEMAIRFNLAEGAYVQTVVSESSADKAGIRRGDVITQFDGHKVNSTGTELSKYIASKKVGDSVGITLYREGQSLNVTARLEASPAQ